MTVMLTHERSEEQNGTSNDSLSIFIYIQVYFDATNVLSMHFADF